MDTFFFIIVKIKWTELLREAENIRSRVEHVNEHSAALH